MLCLLFAFVMQIDANLVNDFFDYVRGTDDQTTRLGPERACASGWVTLDAMKYAIASTTVLACLVAATLPNPRLYSSAHPSGYVLSRRDHILREMKYVTPLDTGR